MAESTLDETIPARGGQRHLTVLNTYVPIYGGEAVSRGEEVVGRLRSTAYGFTVKKNLAYSYLPVELKPGDDVEVEVFGQKVPSTVLRDRRG